METFATIIVTAQKADEARTLAATFPGGEGMLTAALSASGNEPATHFISSGTMPQELVEAVADLTEVSELQPSEAMQAAGLTICAPAD